MLAIFNYSTAYEVLGVLHVLAAIVAFGPLFLYPALQRNGETRTIAKMHMMLALPAMVLVWVFGMGLVGMADDTKGPAIEMSEPWIVVSLAGWVVAMVVSWFMIRPALADTGEAARSRMAAGIGISHLILVVALIMMIFKPGGNF
ncbi:MAG: hypothetical protein ACK5OX_01810 [Desertimonas sp.]